ncbi:MAG: HD domain-containing protein [Clostridia bacterium]|nr:HD domain-containing protein [Clostridia bacterium]
MAENIYNEDINVRFNKKLQFLILIDKMKSVYRQTLLADKSRRETDAEHSWHIAMMAMLFAEFAPEGVDKERVIKMCLVHDLVEIYAGDTFCYDEKAGEDKAEREMRAAQKLFSVLPAEDGEEIKGLWLEFEKQETPDAVFVASLDRFQPLINNFLTDGHTWRKGKVVRPQVEERAALIKKGLPIACETVQKILDDAENKGFFEHNQKN